jgi:hypothetical protein
MLVSVIVTLMITIYSSKVNFSTIKTKVKSGARVVGGRDASGSCIKQRIYGT